MFYLTLGPLGREHFNCTSVGCIYLLTKALSIRKLIVTITKFSIMTGSSCENLSRNRRAITSVSNCSCIQFELFVIGYARYLTSITRALMASFAMFLTVFKTYEKRCRRFRSKEVLKKHFYPEICYRYDQLVTGPRVVQFEMGIGLSGVQFRRKSYYQLIIKITISE